MKTFVLIGLVLIVVRFSDRTAIKAERQNNPNSDLARIASENLNEYWQNLTLVFGRHLASQHRPIWDAWKSAIRKHDLQNTIRPKCLAVLDLMIQKPLEHEWIAQMIDASHMVPPGIMSSTVTELGDFDQCQSISGIFQDSPFVGKYCLATVGLPRQNKFKHPIPLDPSSLEHPWMADYIQKWYENDNYFTTASAICFPSICHQEEIQKILLSYFEVLNMFEFNVTYCQSAVEPRQYQIELWIALAILVLPWFIIIPATIIEFFNDSNDDEEKNVSIFYQILKCFSLISNNRYLFRIEPTNIDSSIKHEFQFIHGLRAFGALIVIMAHSAGLIMVLSFMPVSLLSRYPNDMIEMGNLLIAQPFYNGALVVLIFFFISGYLLVFTSLSLRRIKISFVPYVLVRYIRLTPPLIGMICLNIVLELFGSGPLFHSDILHETLRPCYQNWWIHLLYLTNWFEVSEMCNIQTWYVSSEMHLYILAFFLIWLYTRNRRLMIWACLSLVVLGMAMIVLIVAFKFTPITLVQILVRTKYIPPWRVSRFIFFADYLQFIPYFLGCALGVLVQENRIFRLSKFKTNLFWSLSFFFLLIIPFSSYALVRNEYKVAGDETITNAITFSITILIFSLSIGWVIYQCSVDQSSLTYQILSANFLKPISRLSFCLYLSHLMIIWFQAFQTRTTVSMATLLEVAKNVSITMFGAFFLGYLLHLSFEAPTVGLLQLFFKTRLAKQQKVSTKNGDNNNDSAIEEDSKEIDYPSKPNKQNKDVLDSEKKPEKKMVRIKT